MNIINSKPLQKISWAEKIKDDKQWFKNNIDFFISGSIFGDSKNTTGRINRIKTLYEIYNSKFPTSWFKHVTNPFSGKDNNRVWPAKIRPMNILRPNIEYLRGEYPKRPFNWQVVQKGEDGYIAFMEERKKLIYNNLSQIFINTLNQVNEEQELGYDTGVDSKPVEMPEEIVNKFVGSFKNMLAVQAQTDIELIMEDQRVREKFIDGMKDWLIAGEVYSYKDVIRDETIYERVDPTEIDYDKSPGIKYVKDGDWVIRRMLMVVSDVVDRFYDSLKGSEIDKMENGDYSQTPLAFSNFLHEHTRGTDGDKIPVYHVTWRTFEKFGILTYPNPITGKMEQDTVNETYKANPELGETIEWHWRSRWYQGYRISDLTYVEMQPVRFSPSMINDLGKTSGPYNGRCFSDTHAENISVLKMGLPFQIMYIIANFAMERTLAKSRGKVVLIDQNIIPKKNGWDEEKFFHFAEAQGWGLIDRNQIGVDKSFNQYQVMDLSLFDHIAELISIMDFCKRQYDEQLGISRQSKAQVTSSDRVGNTEAAIFQSSVITDMIFTDFEQWTRTELEGLLDCSQISNINGKRSSYVSSEGRTSILSINAEEYSYSQMGIMMSDSTKDNDALRRIRQYNQAFAQNGVPMSAIIESETTNNIAGLKAMALKVEQRQQEIEAQMAQNEQEAQMAQIELQQQFAEYNSLLDTQRMHEEYNRKEDLVLIQGDINMALESAANQPEDSSVEGTKALMDYANQSAKIEAENDRKNKELGMKVQAQKNKEKAQTSMDNHKRKMDEKDHQLKVQVKNKELQIKKQQAKSKPAAKK